MSNDKTRIAKQGELLPSLFRRLGAVLDAINELQQRDAEEGHKVLRANPASSR